MTLPKCKCIYAIKNKQNRKMYVGKTIDFRWRIKEHKRKLKNGSHVNPNIQKECDEIGINKFEFIILEKVQSKNSLTKKEKHYIQKVIPEEKLYNIQDYKKNFKGKNVQITKEQDKQLKKESYEKDISQSEIIREALQNYFKEENKND